MRAVLVALAVVIGTGCAGLRGEPSPVEATPVDDAALVLGDVQYLLGEAVAAHAAEARAIAERSWGDAVAKWRDVLAPRVRAVDPKKALEIEYALGRLGDALRRPGGRAATLYKPLDKSLRDLQPVLEATATAPHPSQEPH